MARNWSNSTYPGTLDEAVAEVNADRHNRRFVQLIGLTVEGRLHRAGERHTLTPAYNSVGFAPRIGETVECSALGLGSEWTVVEVAEGYPGSLTVERA